MTTPNNTDKFEQAKKTVSHHVLNNAPHLLTCDKNLDKIAVDLRSGQSEPYEFNILHVKTPEQLTRFTELVINFVNQTGASWISCDIGGWSDCPSPH